MKKILLAAAVVIPLACGPKSPGASGDDAPDANVVHVFTSLYPDVIEAIRPVVQAQLETAVPGAKVEFVQGGSSRIRRTLDRSVADVLLTSDPSHYVELAKRRKLVPYESPNAAKLPPEARAPDHAWVTARYSVMVIGVVPGRSRPSSFEELRKRPKEGGLSIGDPEFSGTNLVTVARLSSRLGWDFYEEIKARGVVVAGSNSMVMERLETQTTDAGIVLLENLLASKAEGKKVDAVYPKDGAIVVPGPIALLKRARDSKGARAVYDAILSPEVQKLLVKKGHLHAADPGEAPPAGAPDLAELLKGAPLSSVFEPVDAAAVKAKFATLFAADAVATPTPAPAP